MSCRNNYFLVSDENDSIEEVREIAKFIASVNENIPLHLSRYFPRYKMDNAATKIEKIIEAQNEAKKVFKICIYRKCARCR